MSAPRAFRLERRYGSNCIAETWNVSQEDLMRVSAARISFPSLEAAIRFLFPEAEVR